MPFSSPSFLQDPFLFTYNLGRGAARWRDALGRVRDVYPSGSTTVYGADVVVIGDSTSTFGTIYECWPHHLKVMLQEKFNRTGVVGGFGFSPFKTQGSGSNDWNVWSVYTFTVSLSAATAGATYTNSGRTYTVQTTIAAGTTLICYGAADGNGVSTPAASGTLTKASGTGDATITFSSVVATSQWDPAFHDTSNPGAGGVQFKTAANANPARIWRYFDPTATGGVWKRQGVTDWNYVGLSYATLANSVYCDSAASNGVLAVSTAVAGPDAGGAEHWGSHYTRQTGLTATTAYTLQVAVKTATDQAWANGVILFNGDINEGIRLHNLSSVGSALDYWGSTAEATTNTQNCTGQFFTGANGGARNCKLLLINSMLNDCGISSQYITVATYKAYLQTLVTYYSGLTSRPSVGIVVNQPWDVAVSNSTQVALYDQYRVAAYQVADANPDVCFILDFWKVLTDSTHLQYAPHGAASTGGSMFDREWRNDGTHGSALCNAARARFVFSALSWGL